MYSGSTQIWTGVAGFKVQSANRYTIEPRLLIYNYLIAFSLHAINFEEKENSGSTQIWTGVAGFKVQSANRYTIEPR